MRGVTRPSHKARILLQGDSNSAHTAWAPMPRRRGERGRGRGRFEERRKREKERRNIKKYLADPGESSRGVNP